MQNSHILYQDSYFMSQEEENNIRRSFNFEKDDDEALEIFKYQEYNDLVFNANTIKTNEIVAIADIGRWDGRRTGYKTFSSLSRCLTTECDYAKWYCDQYNLRGEFVHHDGTNYILYRERKDGISDESWQNFLNKIHYGKYTPDDVTRYTKSLRGKFAEIYGW